MNSMEAFGPPVAYTAVTKGTPVYDRDGERIGVVEHVVADEPVDVFHGLIVHTRPLPGRRRYAPARADRRPVRRRGDGLRRPR
jgi:sporulation protein YlmC with PRC-barrel domain